MLKLTTYQRFFLKNIDITKQYSVIEAFSILKDFSDTKFIESIDVSVNLGIDVTKSEQNIRSFSILPHGIGRKLRIILFAKEIEFDVVKKFGVKFCGTYDLVDKIKNGYSNFDIVVSDYDTINIVNKVAKILGPRKLMPNVKFGTISKNIIQTIKNIKMGYICYRNDKNGIIHTIIGKTNFSLNKLKDNLEVFLVSLRKEKPYLFKNVFIKKITLSTTMGFGLSINLNSLSK